MKADASRTRFLFIQTSVLTLFGLLMVYSASMVVAALRGDPSYFFLRQALYAGIGYLFMIALMFLDYHILLKQRAIILLSVCSVLTLMLVFIQPSYKGAHRSLEIGPFSFQPSEIAKLVVLFYLAFYMQKHQADINQPEFRPLSCLMFVGFFAVLIGIEPDFGQAFCLIMIATLLFYIAGLDRKHMRQLFLILVPSFVFSILIAKYRRGRFRIYWTAFRNILKAQHQARHAGIAVGRGGIWGVGLGDGREKFLFLPEAFGDFIYAVIGEELGLVGSLLIAAAYIGYLYWGLKIAVKAPDIGGLYLALGITLMVVFQAFIHISAVLSLIPTKGLTLPFISQGGSSLLVCLMATGVLLNIASQRRTYED